VSAQPFISVVDEPDGTPAASPLSDLKAALAKPLADQTIVLPVPLRDGWTIRYSTNIPMPTVERWRKKAAPKKGDPDMLLFGKLCLAAQCVEIIQDGNVWRDEAGQPLTFQSRELGEAFDVETDLDAVQALYASDGHIVSTTDALTKASGYGDELEPVDPT
jgi:hypothetical protein